MSKIRHHADYVVENLEVQARQDRRGHPRYRSGPNDCWIGWWQGDSARVVAAQLRDISQGGAGLRIRPVPPAGTPIWFCPSRPGKERWIPGTVVRVVHPGLLRVVIGGTCEIGLQFRRICSWETLRAALFGLDGPPEQPGPPPPPPATGESGS